MFQGLHDRLQRFAEKKITCLDDKGQIITDEDAAGDAQKDKIRLVKGASVEAKKGMFQIDPQLKIDMIKNQKIKQMIKNTKKVQSKLKYKPYANETVKILEIIKGGEKEFSKPVTPSIELRGPQQPIEPLKPEDTQSHISFPLKNFFKDKKVKDVAVKDQLQNEETNNTTENITAT